MLLLWRELFALQCLFRKANCRNCGKQGLKIVCWTWTTSLKAKGEVTRKSYGEKNA